ncbi:c-type cytochrome [Acetobacter orleanensis]|uniref:c-type cytochrome n=1 Tax=Acetobacter orleanensis TaxID=104099 RepID=UPI0009E1DD78|nr:c-type cytochrome [Acetobacter orleanensis]PCD79673.1 alcohol dehydrogenase [Acetobacter orleanensis]
MRPYTGHVQKTQRAQKSDKIPFNRRVFLTSPLCGLLLFTSLTTPLLTIPVLAIPGLATLALATQTLTTPALAAETQGAHSGSSATSSLPVPAPPVIPSASPAASSGTSPANTLSAPTALPSPAPEITQHPSTAITPSVSTDSATHTLIAKGRYVAAAADCAACHSMPGAAPYSGGYAFQLPIGTLYSSNITPDKTHGIGNWTEAQFMRAIREGVRPDGASLYPAMPFPSYARMTDADLHALYAYFMQDVRPVPRAVRPNAIPWPLSMRFPLTVWRWFFAPSPHAARKSAERLFASPQLARGAYLVEGPGHCGACHTKRGLAMQETALTAEDGPHYLAGGAPVDGWTPPSLRGEPRTGLGAWSEADLIAFLRTGRNLHGSSFGNMDTAVHHGTQYLTDNDLTAMAAYLKSLPPADETQSLWQPDLTATHALQAGGRLTPGQQLYLDNCAACHRSSGAGYAPAFPPLAGNPVVQSSTPDSLIHIVLTGATLHGTASAPSAFTMPGFGNRLSNTQVATVVTFIRQAWGNNGSAVQAADVKRLRNEITPSTMQSAPPTPMEPAPPQPNDIPKPPDASEHPAPQPAASTPASTDNR